MGPVCGNSTKFHSENIAAPWDMTGFEEKKLTNYCIPQKISLKLCNKNT